MATSETKTETEIETIMVGVERHPAPDYLSVHFPFPLTDLWPEGVGYLSCDRKEDKGGHIAAVVEVEGVERFENAARHHITVTFGRMFQAEDVAEGIARVVLDRSGREDAQLDMCAVKSRHSKG